MNSHRIIFGILHYFFLTVFVLWGFSCSSTKFVHYTGNTPEIESEQNAQEITVIEYGESIPQAYNILGHVYSYRFGTSRFQNPSWKDIDRDLKSGARKLGANAIIGLHLDKKDERRSSGFVKWGSGIAAKLLQENEQPINTRGSFIITALSFIVPENMKDKTNKIGKTQKELNRATRFVLERKGYYFLAPDSSISAVTIEDLQAMTDVQLASIGGTWPDLLLEIQLLDSGSGYNVGIIAERTVSMKGRIFSKSKRRIIWSGEAALRRTGFGLGATVGIGGAALRKTVAKLFETVPLLYKESEGT